MQRSRRRAPKARAALLQTPELPRDFLDKRDGWLAFVQSGLMPNYAARDPFAASGLGSSLEQMQREVPLSARGGLAASLPGGASGAGRYSGANGDAPPASPRGGGGWGGGFQPERASEAALLEKLADARPQHYVPAERGTVRQLHVLLENTKELALQAEGLTHAARYAALPPAPALGAPAPGAVTPCLTRRVRSTRHSHVRRPPPLPVRSSGEADSNMATVRRFVCELWQESNRLNAREAQLLLSEMFYQVAQQPAQVARLMALWYAAAAAVAVAASHTSARRASDGCVCSSPTSLRVLTRAPAVAVGSRRLEMLSHAEHSRANVFLDPTRLALLPFSAVFISSNALQLALSHYLRHPPETLPSGEKGSSRGGIDAKVLDQLLRFCLGMDRQTMEKLRGHIASMAAMATPSASVSSAVRSPPPPPSHNARHALHSRWPPASHAVHVRWPVDGFRLTDMHTHARAHAPLLAPD